MERKLVAILAVDAVGYSRLVGEDEEGALALLNVHRALIENVVTSHQGRTFGGAGDSIMAEFGSPVEALRSAIEIQQRIGASLDHVGADGRMLFRIGLNLGDVVAKEENLFGEAVNVAARLESLSPPGGICLSEAAYEQVKHLPGVVFEDLGKHRLKNIQFPVRVFGWRGTNTEDYKKAPRQQSWLAPAVGIAAAVGILGLSFFYDDFFLMPGTNSTAQASIAVLPLSNLSGDATQDYFSDGLTNDITTDLSKFSNLFVIASNSAFTYKNKPSKVQDIGKELGARYLLEGTVLRTADRVRINAQLIDTQTGHHIWAERYDRALGELFTVQDEVIQRIVTALAIKVSDAETERVSREDTSNMSAYDKYLQGKAVIADPNKITPQGNDEARGYFEEAIKLDPNFARAYGELSYLCIRDAQNDWGKKDHTASLQDAEKLALKALSLKDDYDSRWGLAMVYSNQGEFEKSFEQYEIARNQNPNDPDLAAEMGEALMYAGNHDRAINQIRDAINHSPVEPPYWHYWVLARAYYMAKQYKEALAAIAKIVEPPNDVLLIAAASKAQLGDIAAAKKDMAEFSKNDPNWSIAKSADYYYRYDADRQHWLDGLRKAGLKEK